MLLWAVAVVAHEATASATDGSGGDFNLGVASADWLAVASGRQARRSNKEKTKIVMSDLAVKSDDDHFIEREYLK